MNIPCVSKLVPSKWLSLIFLAILIAKPTAVFAKDTKDATSTTSHPVIGYFDATGTSGGISRIPWKYLTHLNIAFAGISTDGTCQWMDASGNDKMANPKAFSATVDKLIAARNTYNPSTKLVLSVGGWTMSYRFSEATKTPEASQKLAASCVDMVQNLGLDGLDYDWEYPTKVGAKNCPESLSNTGCQAQQDPQQFSQLLKDSRNILGDDTVGHPLSVAVFMVPGDKGIPYDVAGMDPSLSFWNIMAYDAQAPSWSPGTGFHSPIRGSQQSLIAFANLGATPAKLNLGVPFYGYVWKNISGPELNCSGPGNQKNSSQYYTSSLLKRYVTNPGCKIYTDRDGQFFYCSEGTYAGQWAAVDTTKVLWEKSTYVRDNGFGGVMFWAVQGDSQMGDLARTIYGALNP